MFVNVHILNDSLLFPGGFLFTFAVLLKSKSKTPMFVAIIIIFFLKQWSISLTKNSHQVSGKKKKKKEEEEDKFMNFRITIQ
jgi:Co/Zn/Cd efflux system component